MIKTKDLVRFLETDVLRLNKPYKVGYHEYVEEVIARLKEKDKLKEGIEKLCRDLDKSSPLDEPQCDYE